VKSEVGMRTVRLKAVNKKLDQVNEFNLQLADNLQEALQLAGGEHNLVEMFNRQWRLVNLNRNRPRPSAKPRKRTTIKFSPEIQALLRGKTDEEIQSLLEQALKAM